MIFSGREWGCLFVGNAHFSVFQPQDSICLCFKQTKKLSKHLSIYPYCVMVIILAGYVISLISYSVLTVSFMLPFRKIIKVQYTTYSVIKTGC